MDIPGEGDVRDLEVSVKDPLEEKLDNLLSVYKRDGFLAFNSVKFLCDLKGSWKKLDLTQKIFQ